MRRTSAAGFTLVELVVYCGLATSMILMILSFEVLGRNITSHHFTQVNILSMASVAMDEISLQVKSCCEVSKCKSEELVLKKQVDGKLVEMAFVWNRQDRALYQRRTVGKKQTQNYLSSFVKEVKFTQVAKSSSAKPHLQVRLVFSSQYLGESYSLVLERTLSLAGKEIKQ